MSTQSQNIEAKDPALSLYNLLDPGVLANPYPLYRRLRTEDPIHWDTFLHAWVVTRYTDVLTVLHNFSARCAPTPTSLAAMGLSELAPIARVMMQQMLFMDPPAHTRLRALSSHVFAPRNVEGLRKHIQQIVDDLLEKVEHRGGMDVIAELANLLPTIVTSEMMGLPAGDVDQLKAWSADFAEILGNFQHNSDHAPRMLKTLDEMTMFFRDAIRHLRRHPRDGVISALMSAEINGDRLSEEMLIANCIIVMVGGQETTPNLIGNGLLTLLRHPDQLEKLRANLSFIPSAVEELLRYESPSQHTTRVAPQDTVLGGKTIHKGQSVIAVLGAANRDPERFPEPDCVDICRKDNRHLAFGAGGHFCFGAPLARLEGQIAFESVLRRFSKLTLVPGPLVWRENLGLRGLQALSVSFC